MTLFLLLLVLSPLLLFLLHGVFSHGVLAGGVRVSSPAVAIASIVAGFMATLALAWFLYLAYLDSTAQRLYGLFYATIVYGCFSYAYLHLFLMGETARRLHILYELKVHGPLTRTQITERYGAKDMLGARLERLVGMQQLRVEGQRYVLQKIFLVCASKILIGWGKILGFRAEALK